jgi:hypothetical protein
VAPQQLVQAALEGRDIEPAFDTHGEWDIVGGDAWIQLVQKPEPRLRKGERQIIVLLAREDRLLRGDLDAFLFKQIGQQLELLSREAARIRKCVCGHVRCSHSPFSAEGSSADPQPIGA